MIHSRRTLMLAAVISLSAGAARAQGHGEGKDKDRGRGHEEGGKVPPGLAKKPGGMPPGQFRTHHAPREGAGVLRDVLVRRGYTVIRTDNSGTSQYVYYRLRDGAVQRAIVSPGTDQLGFSNVPAALLREVLARLY